MRDWGRDRGALKAHTRALGRAFGMCMCDIAERLWEDVV